MNNEIVNDLFAFVVVLYSLIYLSLKAVEVFAGDCDDGIFDPEYDRIPKAIRAQLCGFSRCGSIGETIEG